MSILDQYPKTYTNMTQRLRALLARVPGADPRECEDLARAINGMADKACDLHDIFQRMLQEPLPVQELADLLVAFELTTEQIRGDSDTIDGKLYDLSDRLREGLSAASSDSA
jgi:hypothetical protein